MKYNIYNFVKGLNTYLDIPAEFRTPPTNQAVLDKIKLWDEHKRSPYFVVSHLRWLIDKTKQFGSLETAVALYDELDIENQSL